MNPLALSNVIMFICSGLMIVFLVTHNTTFWLLSFCGWLFTVATCFVLWQFEKVGDYSWRI
jgi:hypothetical protein